MRILRVKSLEYCLHKAEEKALHKDIQKGSFCGLCILRNIRKMFLTHKGLSIRERMLLRIDMGLQATKAPF